MSQATEPPAVPHLEVIANIFTFIYAKCKEDIKASSIHQRRISIFTKRTLIHVKRLISPIVTNKQITVAIEFCLKPVLQ